MREGDGSKEDRKADKRRDTKRARKHAMGKTEIQGGRVSEATHTDIYFICCF